jgi:hypothetical protein
MSPSLTMTSPTLTPIRKRMHRPSGSPRQARSGTRVSPPRRRANVTLHAREEIMRQMKIDELSTLDSDRRALLPVYQKRCAPTDADSRQDHHAPRDEPALCRPVIMMTRMPAVRHS